MAKQRRRRYSVVNAALPIFDEHVFTPGQRVTVYSPAGKPADPKTDLSSSYLVPRPFKLQPLFFGCFLDVEELLDAQVEHLGFILGASITPDFRKELDRSISRFVATVALAGRFPDWKDLEDQLRLVIEVGTALVEASQKFAKLTFFTVFDNSPAVGALSAEMTVKHFVREHVRGKPRILLNIDEIISICKSALVEIAPKAATPGRKPDVAFRFFCRL